MRVDSPSKNSRELQHANTIDTYILLGSIAACIATAVASTQGGKGWSSAGAFGIQLYRLQEGTHWIGELYSNSDGEKLDLNGIITFCRGGINRMPTKCNKKWHSSDKDMNLRKGLTQTSKPEIQWLQKKHDGRLDLPLVVRMHTALRLSVTYRSHGLGILSDGLGGV